MQIEISSVNSAGEDEIFIGFEISSDGKIERRRLLLPTSTYIELKIQAGRINCDFYDLIEREAQIYSAYKRGLHILEYGSCSKCMLISKLTAKNHSRDTAQIAVERIESHGFLSESKSAVREAERCAAKLWGKSRICAHLRSKGYDKSAVEKAMFALEDEDIDFSENCRKLIISKYGKLPGDRIGLQKLISSIRRFGYSFGEIQAALRKIANEKPGLYY